MSRSMAIVTAGISAPLRRRSAYAAKIDDSVVSKYSFSPIASAIDIATPEDSSKPSMQILMTRTIPSSHRRLAFVIGASRQIRRFLRMLSMIGSTFFLPRQFSLGF